MKPVILVFVVALAIWAAFAIAIVHEKPNPPITTGSVYSPPASQSSSGDSIEARVFCKYVVENSLKSPSTAQFSSYGDTTATRSGSAWVINGYVDSQNSFGAKLRADYRCTASGAGKDLKLDDLSITPR